MSKRSKKLIAHAKDLRSNQTKAESLVWTILRGRRLGGLKFRRQYPISPYIVDFACVEQRVVIEIDGGYHEMIYEQDQERQRELEALGWKVVRLGNENVLEDADGAANFISKVLGIDA